MKNLLSPTYSRRILYLVSRCTRLDSYTPICLLIKGKAFWKICNSIKWTDYSFRDFEWMKSDRFKTMSFYFVKILQLRTNERVSMAISRIKSFINKFWLLEFNKIFVQLGQSLHGPFHGATLTSMRLFL